MRMRMIFQILPHERKNIYTVSLFKIFHISVKQLKNVYVYISRCVFIAQEYQTRYSIFNNGKKWEILKLLQIYKNVQKSKLMLICTIMSSNKF